AEPGGQRNGQRGLPRTRISHHADPPHGRNGAVKLRLTGVSRPGRRQTCTSERISGYQFGLRSLPTRCGIRKLTRQRRRKERPVRRPSTSVRLAALVTALALLLVACGGGSKNKSAKGATAAKQGGVFRLGIVEPTAIDPYNSQESEGILVTKQLFTGLVEIDNATSEIKPGVAEKWEKNGDCTQWTFHLRSGTTFSNGEQVDANAFIRGMTRAAKQAAASDVAYHMAGVAGYTDIHGTGAPGSKAT